MKTNEQLTHERIERAYMLLGEDNFNRGQVLSNPLYVRSFWPREDTLLFYRDRRGAAHSVQQKIIRIDVNERQSSATLIFCDSRCKPHAINMSIEALADSVIDIYRQQ